jgi:hypothetical protein
VQLREPARLERAHSECMHCSASLCAHACWERTLYPLEARSARARACRAGFVLLWPVEL